MQCISLRSSDNLTEKLEEIKWKPQIAILSYEESFNFSKTRDDLKKIYPELHFFGASSCQGYMDDLGLSQDQASASIFLMGEEGLQVGVAQIDKSSEPFKDGVSAIDQACENANSPGQTPDLVLTFSAPGDEEEIINGIVSVIGDDVPVIGGSAADNTISGNWSQIAGDKVAQNSVNIVAFFNDSKISTYFHSGFEPNKTSGVVTMTEGREIIEIDNKPAALVYNEWTNNSFVKEIETRPNNILASSSLFPLGRKTGKRMSNSFYKLSHPETITTRLGLTTFTTVVEGERIYAMEGTFETIINRTLRVLNQAKEIAQIEHEEITGVILTFCAGCRLTLGDDMSKVYDLINSEFLNNKIPLTTFFTFGEQGHIANETNIHGNLMISAVLLTE